MVEMIDLASIEKASFRGREREEFGSPMFQARLRRIFANNTNQYRGAEAWNKVLVEAKADKSKIWNLGIREGWFEEGRDLTGVWKAVANNAWERTLANISEIFANPGAMLTLFPELCELEPIKLMVGKLQEESNDPNWLRKFREVEERVEGALAEIPIDENRTVLSQIEKWLSDASQLDDEMKVVVKNAVDLAADWVNQHYNDQATTTLTLKAFMEVKAAKIRRKIRKLKSTSETFKKLVGEITGQGQSYYTLQNGEINKKASPK